MAVALCLAAPLAYAQTPAPSLLTQLKNVGGPLGSEQGMAAVGEWVRLEVSTAPLGTSTGGFTFTYDPILRVWRRSSATYGPAFAERSLTTGRRKISAGMNFLPASYSSFNGQSLEGDQFRPARSIQGFTPMPTASYSVLNIDLSSRTLAVYGHAGITDHLDIGVAVPWTSVSLSADGGLISTSGARLATSGIAPNDAAGIGDIAIFGKYRFMRQEEGGLAAAVELRLPTGDTEAFRGLGVTRTLVSGIWSRGGGAFQPHVNLGYELWSDAVSLARDNSVRVKDQWRYAFGFELAAHPRATVLVDVLGRHLRGGSVDYAQFTGLVGSQVEALVANRSGVHRITLAPGVKLNAWGSSLVTVTFLAPLTSEGLRPAPSAVIGLDWAF